MPRRHLLEYLLAQNQKLKQEVSTLMWCSNCWLWTSTYHVESFSVSPLLFLGYCLNFVKVSWILSTYPKQLFRSSHPEVFLRKGALKKCSKFTGEHPCRSVTSVKLLWNFGMGVLLWIWCIFSEHLLLRIPLEGCFWLFLIVSLNGYF